MLNQHLDLFDPPKHAGLKYHLIKVKRPGAFHPKLVVQLGRKKARLMAGSANLTASGLAGNLELVFTILAERQDIDRAQIINSALDYVSKSVDTQDEWFRAGLALARRRSSWLHDIGSQDEIDLGELGALAFIHDQKHENGLDQFVSLIGEDPISNLTIVSPYWDKRLEALERLQSELNVSKTQLILDEERQLFPTTSIKQSADISFHSASSLTGSRRLHAKLFIARGESYDHVLSGSFNCSAPALFSSAKNPRNAEAGIYRRIDKDTAIGKLGLSECLAHSIEFDKLPDYLDPTDVESEVTSARDGGRLVKSQFVLVWHRPGTSVSPAQSLLLFRNDGSPIGEAIPIVRQENDDDLTFTVELGDTLRQASFGKIVFQDGPKSAPISITNIETLQISAREIATGKIARKLSALIDFSAEGLGIIDILIELNELSSGDTPDTLPARRASHRLSRDTDNDTFPILTYEDFISGRDQQVRAKSNPIGIALDDTYNADVRQTLNRFLGMINTPHDMAGDEDENPQDLGPREPQHEDDVETLNAFRHETNVEPEQTLKTGHRKFIRHTCTQLTNGVANFENMMKNRQDSPIRQCDIVHIRALLQTIMAFSVPITGASKMQHVLPSHDGSTADWPRLLGKIVQSVFRKGPAPFATLETPTVISQTPDVVLECWAAMACAMKFSGAVLTRTSKASPTARAVASLGEKLQSRIAIETAGKVEAGERLNELISAFEARFSYLVER